MAYQPLSVAAYYVALFAPRLDAYARWTNEGWRPVREALTPEVALAGLTRTGPSISAYMITPEALSHVLAVDFDTDDGISQAYDLAKTMKGVGLVPYVEASRRGAHLFAVLDLAIPAKTIRRAVDVMMAASLIAPDPHIEVRPGSDTIAEGGLGHAIRMPLMPHPKTGKSYRLHDADGALVGDSVASILLDFQQSAHHIVEGVAIKYTPPALKRLPKDFRRSVTGPDPYADASASDILRSLWGVENARPGKAVRCPAHDDKHPSLSILRDDRRAICKAPHCILSNDGHGRGTYELTTLAPKPS